MLFNPGFHKYFCLFSPKRSSLILLFLISCVISDCYAQGDLFINPKRIVFESAKLSQEISLANTGNDTASYVISFVQIRLKQDGNFQIIEQPDSGQRFADKNLRIFPRKVTLGPKESQTIKVQVYQKNKLSEGEYRSHLYVRATHTNNPLGDKKEKDTTKNVVVKLVPVYGVTIPVIIRIGTNNSKAFITDLKIEQQNSGYALKFCLNRSGNMSVYGDVNVDYLTEDGKTNSAGQIKGLSLYTPNLLRDISINLDRNISFNSHKGKLRVTYTNISTDKTEKIATAELNLQ